MTAAAPAPWTLEPRDECGGFRLVDADGCLIEYLNESRYIDGRDDPTHLASLRLMQAAPEMRDLLRDVSDPDRFRGRETFERIHALLARLESGQ